MEANGELHSRRLRFSDEALERAFRRDYAEKSRVQLRLVMLLGLLLQVLLTVHALAIQPDTTADVWFWISRLSAVLLLIGGLALTYTRDFARVAQPYMILFGLVVGGTFIAFASRRPEGYSAVLLFGVAAYTLFKLRTPPAFLINMVLMVLFLAISTHVERLDPEILGERLFFIFVMNFIGIVACFLIEQSARRDFLLSHLLEAERQKAERLLLNILPEPIADRLKDNPSIIADSFAEVTVLFADLENFTPRSAQMPPTRVVTLLNEIFSAFDGLVDRHGLEKIKTIGDAYMVVGGLPVPRADHAEAVAALALEMPETISRFRWENGAPIRLRIGINSGPVVAGVIGTRKFIYDLWGDTVNLASRMQTHGVAGSIQVAPATWEHLRGKFVLRERGHINVKGKGEMKVYVLTGKKADADAPARQPVAVRS